MREPSAVSRSSFVSVVAVWAALVLLGLHVHVDLNRSLSDAREQGQRVANSYVRLVAEHAAGTFDRADLVLEQAVQLPTAADMANARTLDPERRLRLESRLLELQGKVQAIVSMTMTDRDGYVFANTVGTPPGGSLGDRGYFLALKDGVGKGPAVSEVVKGRVSNKWGIQVARRIEGKDGSFAGMVVANVGMTSYMEGFYGSLSLPAGSIISLRDGKNRVIVRHPVNEALFGKPVPSPEADQILASGAEEGTFVRVSPVDGTERLHALKKLPRYDIYALVGLDMAEMLSGWTQSRRQAIAILGIAFVAAVIATLLLFGKMRADRSLIEQLSFQKVVLDTLPIPLFARSKDGLMMACNRAYETFFGTTRSQVLGRTVNELFPPDLARHYATADQEVMLSGQTSTYETDVIAASGAKRHVVMDKAVYHDAEGRVAGVVATLVDITEREALEQELKRLSTLDTLTGVSVRRHFLTRAEAVLSRQGVESGRHCLLLVSIDGFSAINRRHGHDVGDDVIRGFAKTIAATLRDIDLLGRLGGKTFAALLTEMDVDAARMLAQRLEQAIGALAVAGNDGTLVRGSASMGLVPVSGGEDGFRTALMLAETAVVSARTKGGGVVVVASA